MDLTFQRNFAFSKITFKYNIFPSHWFNLNTHFNAKTRFQINFINISYEIRLIRIIIQCLKVDKLTIKAFG